MKRGWMMALALIAGLGCALALAPAEPVKAGEDEGGPEILEFIDVEDLAEADNQFGCELFKQLHKDGNNTFISPTSIAMTLHMATEGAKGETKQEMLKATHTEEIDIKKQCRGLLEILDDREGVKIDIANSLWADPASLTLDKEFITTLKENYRAEARAVDFADPGTVDQINKWVADNTSDKIQKLFESLSPATVGVLCNAVYFKGEWSQPFDKDDTKDADFHLPGGETKTVRMMELDSENIQYGKFDDAQVAVLDYGEDWSAHMMIVLPGEDSSLDKVVAKLSNEQIEEWVEESWECEGVLKLPRFKMSYKTGLNESLQTLGIQSAFDRSKADFSGMGKINAEVEAERFFIGQVVHEAVIEVNEEGTEAAAASGISFEAESADEPFEMVVDRPFLVLIRDDDSGAVLFIGTVYQPENLD